MNLHGSGKELFAAFKGENYIFGSWCFKQIGKLVASQGKKAFLVSRYVFRAARCLSRRSAQSLKAAGVDHHR